MWVEIYLIKVENIPTLVCIRLSSRRDQDARIALFPVGAHKPDQADYCCASMKTEHQSDWLLIRLVCQ